MAGAALGLILAGSGTRGVVTVLGRALGSLPFRDLSTISLDLRVFAVTALVALLAGLIAGLAPALTVLPSEPGEVLRDSEGRGSTARRGRQLKNALVSVEVGLALMVLVGAALLLTSIRKVLGVEPGLNPTNVVVMDMSLPQPDFYGPAVRTSFCEQQASFVGAVARVVLERRSAACLSPVPARAGAS